MVMLNRRIIKALIKEEEDTSVRYSRLAKKYNIPELMEAARDEAGHARLFERIMKRF